MLAYKRFNVHLKTLQNVQFVPWKKAIKVLCSYIVNKIHRWANGKKRNKQKQVHFTNVNLENTFNIVLNANTSGSVLLLVLSVATLRARIV